MFFLDNVCHWESTTEPKWYANELSFEPEYVPKYYMSKRGWEEV